MGNAIKNLLRHPSRLALACITIFCVYLVFTSLDHSKILQITRDRIQRAALQLNPRDNVIRRDHFVYVKIEKTGSSTLSNIFSTYGLKHELNMMMSTLKESLVNTREMDPGRSWDIGPNRSHLHVMEQHARFSEMFYSKHFPYNTVYITSLRNPIKWFISYVEYMSTYNHMDPRVVLETDRLFYKRRNWITGMQKHAHNVFLQWLGFDVDKSDDLSAIMHYIDYLDKKFDFILITEYFDESLVLLKRLMNWSFTDIFYEHANENGKKSGIQFTAEQASKLIDHKHNLGDWLLYQHFNTSLWRKLDQQPDVFEEVAEFRRLNTKVKDFCTREDFGLNPAATLTLHSDWENVIMIQEIDCLPMRLVDGEAPELSQALDAYIPFRGSKTVNDVYPSS